MQVKCRDLLKIIEKNGGKLVGGSAGIDRLVSWCYIVTYEALEDCLRGGELVFIPNYPGKSNEEKQLFQLLDAANRSDAAGVCIMVGSKEIPHMPTTLPEFADQLQLPLFEISWDEWLVDWTYEIGNYLFTYRNMEFNRRMILWEMLTTQVKNPETFNKQIMSLKHDFTVAHSIAVMETDIDRDDYRKGYKASLVYDNFCNTFTDSIYIEEGDQAIFFIPVGKNDDLEKKINDWIGKFLENYPDTKIRVGIGEKTREINRFCESFSQAQKMIRYLRKNHYHNEAFDYTNLGIHYILLMQNDKDELSDYCRKEIGCLVEYEKIRGGDLLNTIETYYRSRFNLMKTSKLLYIHRNTLVHRLETICELIDRDITDPMVCLDVMNAILLYRFLEN